MAPRQSMSLIYIHTYHNYNPTAFISSLVVHTSVQESEDG